MTVREWFRLQRQTEPGRALALEMDRLLTHRLQVDGPVYGIVLVQDYQKYWDWERQKERYRQLWAGLVE